MDILSDKSYNEYNRTSRYSSCAIYYNKLDKKKVTEISKGLDKTTSYSLYTVKNRESYDLISFKAYNNPTYFWVICDFNNILDPYQFPKIGTQLKIPILSEIRFKN